MGKPLIGIDVGGTSGRVGLFTDPASDTIERQERFPISGAYAKDSKELISAIRKTLGDDAPGGIGIGLAGEFDETKGSLHHSPHLKGWIDQPVRDDLAKAFDCPIVVTNDTDAAALAEGVFEDYKDDFWFVTWGTGIGASVVEIFPDGPRVLNAEAGHHVLRWDETSPVCECGKHGCFEAYVGGSSVEKRFGKMVTDLTEPERQDVLDWLARGFYNLVRIYPVDQIVVGGGVAAKQSEHLPAVEQKLNGYLEGFRTVSLGLAKHGEDSGMIGAMAALRQP